MGEIELQKRTSKMRPNESLKFTIYYLIKEGFYPKQIASKLNMTESHLSYYIKQLKASNSISKIGYGVWKAGVFNTKQLQTNAMRHSKPFITSPVKKEVRGHGFRFLVKLPKFFNWSKRRDWLVKNGVVFRDFSFGQSICLRGHRVKLYNRSLDIYFSKEFSLFGESADVCWRFALLELKSFIVAFENLFKVSFGGRVEWSVCRQHYSLVKNALAKDYLLRGEGLKVFDEDNKLWLLVDNSLNLEELENVHTVSARDDSKKVQDFFNGVKATGITPSFILESFNLLIEDRKYYAENLRQHTDSIKILGEQIERLGDIVKK